MRGGLIVIGSCLWLTALAVGFHKSMVWETTPGPKTPEAPHAAALADRMRVVTYAHPECPCTGSTLDVLAELARNRKDLLIEVVIADPEGQSSTNAGRARSIPGAVVTYRTLSEQPEARTSGETFVYDKQGKLCFHGGLTIGRGIETPNRFASNLKDNVKFETQQSEVYGCPLQ